MKTHLKYKYLRGCTAPNNALAEDPVLISCDKFDRRKALRSEKKNITDEE
jgi:hypothetical protein